MLKHLHFKSLLLLLVLFVGGVNHAWAQSLTVDFEKAATTYTDWTFDQMTTQQTNSNVTAHGGSYFGTTGGKAKANLITKNKIAAPQNLQFYVSKQTTNTTESSWYVEVSEDGEKWDVVGEKQSATSMDRGKWVEVTKALTDYKNVYVRINYTGSTAIRCIDDVTLTYTETSDPTPVVKHNVTFSVNGVASDPVEVAEGAAIEFPANPADVDGKKFVGWTLSAIAGTTNIEPTLVKEAVMGTEDVTYYAVFATVDGTAEAKSLEITSATDGVPSSYGTAKTFAECTLGGVKFMIMQMYKNNGKLQWRAAGNTNGTGTMYNTTDLGVIESIVLDYNSSDTGKNFTVTVGNDENPTSGTAITATVSGSTYTFDCASAKVGYFVLTNGSGAGYLDKLTINYTEGSQTISDYCTTVAADNREEVVLSFAEASVEDVELSGDYKGQTLVNESNVSPIVWSSSNEAVATVADGVLTLVGEGTTTIKATFEGNEQYKAAQASYELTVVDSYKPGTEANPYTVEQAIAAIDAGTGVTDVYAKGIVSEIVTAYDSRYGNVSFNISADGETSGSQLQAFRNFSFGGSKHTSAADVQVGDEVVVKGNLTKFGSTYEFAASNTIVAQKKAVSVSNVGYKTYASSLALDFTAVEGLTAYTAKVASDRVSFEPVTKAVAGQTGLLLKGDEKTYYVPVVTEADAVAGNALVGAVEEVADVAAGIYVLLNGTNGVGFYKTTKAFTVGAGTAYLEAPAAARNFIGLGDDEATAISEVAATGRERMQIVDLNGRKVAEGQASGVKLPKGIYIVNGKKVVLK